MNGFYSGFRRQNQGGIVRNARPHPIWDGNLFHPDFTGYLRKPGG
jgi:hypothetical protein